MNRRTWWGLGLLLFLAKGSCADSDESALGDSSGPVYTFIAVHCDPKDQETILRDWKILEDMVVASNDANVKLTLMMTPQWASLIEARPEYQEKLAWWVTQGHEIASHHHSPYHPGQWDGYTNLLPSEFASLGRRMSDFNGSLDDWYTLVSSVAPGVKSGCSNDESDKRSLHDRILYDTCSGFTTNGAYEVGTRAKGDDPLSGANDFILVGKVNGIERKWLGHAIVGGTLMQSAQDAFKTMIGGAYGIVLHTNDFDKTALETWIEFLKKDPETRSATLSEIIESGELPERTIDDETLNRVYPPER